MTRSPATPTADPATVETAGRPSTRQLLDGLRRSRGFVAGEVLEAKIGRICRWSAVERIDAFVVGLSGGLDSAVTLGLLRACADRAGSTVGRVVALCLPIEGDGATGQAAAAERAAAVADRFGAELWTCPLTDAQAAFRAALEAGSGVSLDKWAAGQLLSAVRTPALYGAAALLQSEGHRSVVVGTTNRDEGAYLGFYGKASDGAVDLQPLSDLHKSEVRALAGLLGVPDVVLEAAPSGDVWDGRDDAEMIGADYDDVEMVLRLKELHLDPLRVAAGLRDGERLGRASDAVERLHAVNLHKYAVGSPAVHLDVLPRGVPGGWPDECLSQRWERPPAEVESTWDLSGVVLEAPANLPDVVRVVAATSICGALTAGECAALVQSLDDVRLQPVGVTGVRGTAGVGSTRATAFAPELAAQLWLRVAGAVDSVRFVGPFDATDAHATDDRTGHRTWRVVGLSPLLRFMRYEAGGRHLCHYDAGFDYGDGRRTLASVVFFLAGDDGSGGALRFVADGQEGLPVRERDHRDWARDTDPSEVTLAVPPVAGNAVVFDHRRCHDVETWRGTSPRVIIRGDVVYEAVPDGRDPGVNWKVRRDPYFRTVADTFGEAAVLEAGFFEDADPADAPLDDVDWLCTPTQIVRTSLAAGGDGPPVVLLSTGAFAPLHGGHLAMLEAARSCAEAAGWWVVGGYLSPGHDEYLRLKRGHAVAPASARITDLSAALAPQGWLAVDPWEALHRRVAVNFTDVAARLQAFLCANVDRRIEVAYVCGGDNARFSLAFAPHGRCIVVARPGSEEVSARWRADPRVAGVDRILWARGEHDGASSAQGSTPWSPVRGRLALRLEDAAAVSGLGVDETGWRRFQVALCDTLGRIVDLSSTPVEAQRGAPVAGTISLDPLLPGEVDVGISRLFELGGYRQIGHVARPGSQPIAEQMAAIPAGAWILRDDDRASGGTLDFVRRHLPPQVHVTAVAVAGDAPADADIADSRDFLVGTTDGGLVVALPDGSIGRAPYLLPYVDPAARCGLPPEHAVAVSAAVWELNAATFDGTGLQVGDLPPASRALFAATGAAADEGLDELCRRHAAILNGRRA